MTQKMRRLFLGIPISIDVSKNLEQQVRQFPGRSVPPQNWHLTLHFLGSVEEEKLELIHDALQTLPPGAPFTITFDHLGSFPHPKRAHSLWIGCGEGSPEIQRLVQITGEALSSLGFTIDSRLYTPHLTVRRYSIPHDIVKMIEDHPFSKTSMRVEELILYESILNQGPPQYVKLYTYELGASRPSSHS